MEPQVKHKFIIKDGKQSFLKPKLHEQALLSMNGKGIHYLVYEPEFEPTTTDQHGYYRGGIIRTVCMQTELFAGWDENRIHEFFQSLFLTHKRMEYLQGDTSGAKWEIEVVISESTANLGKRKMAEFITRVIDFLAGEGIEVPEPSTFILKKYASKGKELTEGEV